MTCVTAIFEGARKVLRLRAAAARLRALERQDPGLMRWSIGLDLPPRALVICLSQDASPATDVLHEANWLECWQAADYEIGHWDGLRLRQAARRRMRDRVENGR